MPEQEAGTNPVTNKEGNQPGEVEHPDANGSISNQGLQPSQTARYIRRLARIWSGVILLVGVFLFIGEILASRSPSVSSYPAYENIIPMALFASLFGLAVAWKWELIGGVIAVTGVVVANTVYWISGREARLVVFLVLLPVLIPGLLFLFSWRLHNQGSVE